MERETTALSRARYKALRLPSFPHASTRTRALVSLWGEREADAVLSEVEVETLEVGERPEQLVRERLEGGVREGARGQLEVQGQVHERELAARDVFERLHERFLVDVLVVDAPAVRVK